ncbi:STAS domain-containing protein [Streptomyces sp. NPDC086777]|uniref:STAS domain-containing protein n=1 Tax=Streptomyces sp. NPDC086777 TaxID=3154866 RepID=UPI00344D409E
MLVRDEAERQGATAEPGADAPETPARALRPPQDGTAGDTGGTSRAAGTDGDRPAGAGRSRPRTSGVAQYESHGARVFVAHGTYDAASIAPLAEALRTAADTYARVVVDARGVGFADSTFLNLLISAHRTTDLRVVAPSARLRRLLELTGADKALKVQASLAEATA